MQYRGINYDVGTITLTGELTRAIFDAIVVKKEIDIIKHDLHCNAVRVSGLPIERLSKAAAIALQKGLTVFFSPAQHYDTQQKTIDHILQNAAAAEQLRLQYPHIILVLGCELSIFTNDFIPGEKAEERLKNLFSPLSLLKNKLHIPRSYNRKLYKFLKKVVQEVRQIFHGQITYASGTWEKINWNLFDMIGVDMYRSAFNKATFVAELESYKKIQLPVCIMEFGCCAYNGADDKGAIGWAIVDRTKQPFKIKGNYERDEPVQSKYITELLDIFEQHQVTGAFVFTFISYNYTYNANPKYDLDLASFGIVRSTPGSKNADHQNLEWIPKDAFFALGEYYLAHK